MKRATTLQFRAAVRKVLAKQGIAVAGSWTNGAPMKRWQEVDSGKRTVGVRLGYVGGSVSPAALVRKVEKKLAKQGVTAGTRYTIAACEYRGGGEYLRGTCDYPV